MTLVVRRGDAFPDWCEVKSFSQLDLKPGIEARMAVAERRARLLATAGSFQVRRGGRSQVLREQQFFDLAAGDAVLVASGIAQAVVLEGAWGDELGGCGTFRAENVADPKDRGDPVSYPKHTNIDAHYHDCDEYWLLLEGRAIAVVDGQSAEMRPGDCLLIPMSAIHDMPDAPEPVKAVYFESSLKGRKRVGHLWRHTHGEPDPRE
jgi:mannose-6-phosphate isomerase-like protein (cupin superfamily)